MRRILSIAIAVSILAAWIASDAVGRPGRGGAARPSGAAGGARPNGGNTGGPQSSRPNAGSARINSPGGINGGDFNRNNVGRAGGNNATNRIGGELNQNQFSPPRASSQQLQQFLGGDGGKLKAGEQLTSGEVRANEFARRENAAKSKEQVQTQASQIQSNVQLRADDLFTPAWYAEHPNAWQAAHPHADAWAVATAASVAAWTAAYAGGSDTVVVESGTTEETQGETDETGATGIASDTDATTATATSDPSEWLSIGVFALAQTGQTEPTTLLQLAVNKQGQLNGSYYDLVSDNGTPVSGQIDTKTERAAWTVGENGKNVFATTIETLTSDHGPVMLHLPSGKTQEWHLVRVNKSAK